MDPTDLGPGTATWLGGTGTVFMAGFLCLRKFLSKVAADRAMDNADIGTVRRLNELLDSEREARKLAEAHADRVCQGTLRSGRNRGPHGGEDRGAYQSGGPTY